MASRILNPHHVIFETRLYTQGYAVHMVTLEFKTKEAAFAAAADWNKQSGVDGRYARVYPTY